MANSKVVLITGASSGIGAACARLLGAREFEVILGARRQEKLQVLADEIKAAGGRALPLQADITRLEDIRNLVAETLARHGRIDILINNAGFGRMNWLENLDPSQDIERQIQTNLIGLIWLTREVIPQMIQRRSGHVINVASAASFVATPTYSIYAASKFGVRGFTDALRNEVSMFGVHVSGLYPGTVETEFQEQVGYQRRTGYQMPSSLVLEAEDVAQAVWKIIQKPRRTVIMPGSLRWLIWLNTLLPGISDRLIVRRFVVPERSPP